MLMTTKRADRLHRTTPTPFATNLCVMARTVRLETNSPALLKQAECLFERYGEAAAAPPEFLWRIVADPDAPSGSARAGATALSDGHLRFVTLGEGSFAATDLETRYGTGFLPERLAEKEPDRLTHFFVWIIQLSARALRLVPVSAGCLGHQAKALLLFGPPAGRHPGAGSPDALEFPGERVTFLEFQAGGLCAWRPLRPTPACAATQVPLSLGAARAAASSGQESLTVVACVFLEGPSDGVPHLIPLASKHCVRRLLDLHFSALDAFDGAEQAAVLQEVSELPAYRLAYSGDPAVAAVFLESLLDMHTRLEVQA